MPTKVLDIDLQDIPQEITGLQRYSHALILIRLHGRPIGRATMQVHAGRLAGEALRDTVMQAAGWYVWERWLHDCLGMDAVPTAQPCQTPATVAVCTRDRPEDLRHCLESLMRLPDDGQEILVVDNCPATEATRQLVATFSRVRYVREDRVGLSCARNRALREASHQYVVFTDDDAVPDPGWLRALLRPFSDRLVMCTTGLTMPLELENEVQEWFERLSGFARGFRRAEFDHTNHDPLVSGRIGAGVNMAFRRSVLQRLGPFDEALGTGTPTRAGEENEMFTRILSAGYRIVFEPAALCWHRHRSDWESLRRTLSGYGTGIYATWTRHLVVERDLRVMLLAWKWFWREQLPALRHAWRVRRRKGGTELSLLMAQLRGCCSGPWAYYVARRRLRKLEQESWAK